KLDDVLKDDSATLALARHVGRERRLEPPGRDALDLLQCDGAPKRREQYRRIALVPRAGIEPAGNRLDGGDRTTGAADMPDQACGEEGLADIGSGRGDEDGGHCVWAPLAGAGARPRVRMPSASRSPSSSGCCGVRVSRGRAVPAGTVGGLMATTRKP